MDNVVTPKTSVLCRLRLELRGAVQGVGFRPFVYRLASEAGLSGWVRNGAAGVWLEVEGTRAELERFCARVDHERPRAAVIVSMTQTWLPAEGMQGFTISPSDEGGARTVQVLPDLATCSACLAELRDPGDRRFGYPFTNCTNCGPRFSIISDLPYDRPHTTMAGFALCADCRAEYSQPLDRRFHAQPNACPTCGPHLELWRMPEANAGAAPIRLARGDAALRAAVAAIQAGQIVALKGLGGFHLICDADNAAAVARLRARKQRPRKPFAVLVRDLAMAAALCELPQAAADLLAGPQAPIVLLQRKENREQGTGEQENRERGSAEQLSGYRLAGVAPDNPTLGLLLPSNPLQHLLMEALDSPVVATSGNLSDEPICTDEHEALERLGAIADLFLVHDRPIARHVDDSIAYLVAGEPRLLRRARGYAPAPVLLRKPGPCILGLGAQLKNAIALAVERQVFISQHIGDLASLAAREAFTRVITDLTRLYAAQPEVVAHDLHPDYYSTHVARAMQKAADGRHPEAKPDQFCLTIQHHHAHFAACLAEHQHEGAALGIIWDGTGYGLDGTIWGGEFLLGDVAGSARVAHLRPFMLLGGDAAVRAPRRLALALLHELEGPSAWQRDDLAPLRGLAQPERALLQRMLERGINSLATSSAGRLFDGVAALLGLCQEVSFEGEAAIMLEHVADRYETGCYPFALDGAQLDWRPTLSALLDEQRHGVTIGQISARFHNTMVATMLAVARQVGAGTVALSGGCFQNRLLSERAAAALTAAGMHVLLHRLVPPNDGGICLGQVAAAAARMRG